MSAEKISISLPILVIDNSHDKQNTIIATCPYFNTEYTLNSLTELKDVEISQNTLSDKAKLSLLDLVGLLQEEIQKRYDREGYLEESHDISYYRSRNAPRNGYWITLNLELIAKPKKICEALLPKLAVISAVASQLLLLVSASVSIYVKGVSAPLTLVIVVCTSISTLINFTQSGTAERVARIGAYLDHKSIKKCGRSCSRLPYKPLWITSGIVMAGIWGTTLVGNSISAFSETEIIDKAGAQAGLTFLTPPFILFHALALTIFGGITSGLFGGNFAYSAVSHFCESVIRRCFAEQPAQEVQVEDEEALQRSPLL